MTLYEKIQKKSERYGQLAPIFLDDAEFALKNQWISVNEKLLLEEDGLSIKVLVASTKGNIHLSRYSYDTGRWISNVLDIVFTH